MTQKIDEGMTSEMDLGVIMQEGCPTQPFLHLTIAPIVGEEVLLLLAAVGVLVWLLCAQRRRW